MPKLTHEEILSVTVARRILREAKEILAECRQKGNMRDSVTALLRVTEAERDLVRANTAAKTTTEVVLTPAEAAEQLRRTVEAAPRALQFQIYNEIAERHPDFTAIDAEDEEETPSVLRSIPGGRR